MNVILSIQIACVGILQTSKLNAQSSHGADVLLKFIRSHSEEKEETPKKYSNSICNIFHFDAMQWLIRLLNLCSTFFSHFFPVSACPIFPFIVISVGCVARCASRRPFSIVAMCDEQFFRIFEMARKIHFMSFGSCVFAFVHSVPVVRRKSQFKVTFCCPHSEQEDAPHIACLRLYFSLVLCHWQKFNSEKWQIAICFCLIVEQNRWQLCVCLFVCVHDVKHDKMEFHKIDEKENLCNSNKLPSSAHVSPTDATSRLC